MYYDMCESIWNFLSIVFDDLSIDGVGVGTLGVIILVLSVVIFVLVFEDTDLSLVAADWNGAEVHKQNEDTGHSKHSTEFGKEWSNIVHHQDNAALLWWTLVNIPAVVEERWVADTGAVECIFDVNKEVRDSWRWLSLIN